MADSEPVQKEKVVHTYPLVRVSYNLSMNNLKDLCVQLKHVNKGDYLPNKIFVGK